MVLNAIKTTGILNRFTLGAAIYNYFLFGDMALLKVRNRARQITSIYPLSTQYLRRNPNGDFQYLQQTLDGDIMTKNYHAEDILFLPQYDPAQQVYGMVDWIGGLQSAMLNTDATMFKRRYYKNGAHMGYILYTQTQSLATLIKRVLKMHWHKVKVRATSETCLSIFLMLKRKAFRSYLLGIFLVRTSLPVPRIFQHRTFSP